MIRQAEIDIIGTDADPEFRAHAGHSPPDYRLPVLPRTGQSPTRPAEDRDAVWQPETVTLCGSMRFVERIFAVAAAETTNGAVVLAPFVVVPPGEQPDNAVKRMLDDLHRHKIRMADRVVVVTDETGYIGESTRGEIAYAQALGVPVEVLALYPDGMPSSLPVRSWASNRRARQENDR